MPAGRGRLELIRGCMFTGKTTRLIERLAAALADGNRVAAFKHGADTRYDPLDLVTHDGRRLHAEAVRSVEELLEHSAGFDVVGVDEGQFFGRRLIDAVLAMRDRGQRVIVSGIDNNAWGQRFEPFPALERIADTDEVLSIPCSICGAPARFSQRITPVIDGDMVGGPGDYEPRCRDCFHAMPQPPLPH